MLRRTHGKGNVLRRSEMLVLKRGGGSENPTLYNSQTVTTTRDLSSWETS